MKNMKIKTHTKNVLRLLPIIFSILFCSRLQAQVTIGAREEPNKGALLDLKESSTDGTPNATKGMMLPRVELDNPNKLYPIVSSAQDASEKAKHVGMMVYNTKETSACFSWDRLQKGVYTWNGSKWELTGPEDLAVGVRRHAAKPDVYKSFYSNDFGPAGRWMINNLQAWKYDGVIHSQDPGDESMLIGYGVPRTLDGPSANISGHSYDAAYWCYPGARGGNGETPSDTIRYYGALYTWDAATAGKGGNSGKKNIYNTSGGTAANDEANFLEGNSPGKQQRIQGICPQGWHLPSDYEWNLLEKEIFEHPEKYSHYENNSTFANEGKWNPAWNRNYGWRPDSYAADAHGYAMKCGCYSYNFGPPPGNSKVFPQGGFNVVMSGEAHGGHTYEFGETGTIWSSSSYSQDSAWSRRFEERRRSVYRNSTSRSTFASVRCVQD